MSEVEFSPVNADYFELTRNEVIIVGLVEQGWTRAQIAGYFKHRNPTAYDLEKIRDLIWGLCDFYSCPTADLPSRVREVALERFEGEG